MTEEMTVAAPASTSDQGLTLTGVGKVLGGRTIIDNLDLAVRPGELVSLLGPSGCGKTTTLRMMAGFLDTDAGRIEIEGRDVTALAPEKRPTAMVFQNYALWPHMTVFKNIAYGLTLRKLPKDEIRQRVMAILETVNLTHHVDSRPGQISGGEMQRVALARALVLEPKVLLLDEPLSNLDAKLRLQVRDDIRDLQQRMQITTVLVTHDQDEALSMSDRIAVMNAGRIEQLASPSELYRQPATRFVADFVGAMNFFPGLASAGEVKLADGVVVPCDDVTGRGEVELAVRPEDVKLAPASAKRGAVGTVVRSAPRGHYTEIAVAIGATQVRAFVESTFVESTVRVTFRRALAYQDGRLLP